MRGKLLAATISAMLAVSVFAVGCGGGGKASDEIKIGVVSEMTGSNATYGTSVVNGMKLALKEVNDKGGVLGKKVNIVVADSKSEPAEAANAMSKLINQTRPRLFMGIFTSSSAIAAAMSAKRQSSFPGNRCNKSKGNA
jgi:branched-chain amino acid transport system substrate-binding protein